MPVNNDDVVFGPTGIGLSNTDNLGSMTFNSLSITGQNWNITLANKNTVSGAKTTLTTTLTLGSGSTLTVGDGATGSSTLTAVNGGTINGNLVAGSGGSVVLGGSYDATNGTLTGTPGNFTFNAINLTNGTLTGTFSAKGANTLTGVTVNGNSDSITVTGGTTTFAGGTNNGTLQAIAGTLIIDGTTTAVTNSTGIEASGGAVTVKGTVNGGFLTNNTGTYTLNDATLNTSTLSGTIQSKGTTQLNGVTVNNQLNVIGGTTTMAGGIVSSGAQLQTQGGNLVLDGTTNQVINSGTVSAVTGAVTVKGSVDNTGGILQASSDTLTLNGASVGSGQILGSVTSKGATSLTGVTYGTTVADTLQVTGGTTTFSGGTNNGTLQANGGSLIVTGTVTNNGAITQNDLASTGKTTLTDTTLTGGTLNGTIGATGTNSLSGVTINASTDTLTIKSGSTTFADGTVNGMLQTDGGDLTVTGNVAMGAGGIINQNNHGSVTLNNATVTGGEFQNIIGATGTNQLNQVFVCSCVQMNVTSGTTTFNGGDNTGVLVAKAGGTLVLDGTTNAFTNEFEVIAKGGDVVVKGDVTGNFGVFGNVGGTLKVEGANISGVAALVGNVEITANTTLTSTGTIAGGDPFGFGPGTTTTDAGVTTTFNGEFQSVGTLKVDNGGVLAFTNGSALDSGDINTNGGLVTLNGNVAFTNTNTGNFHAEVQSGTWTVDTFDNTANTTTTIDNGATLAVTSGSITLNGGTLTIRNGGTVDPLSYDQLTGTLNLRGTLDADTVNLEGGDINVGQNGIFETTADVTNSIELSVAGDTHEASWTLDSYTQTTDGTLDLNINSASDFDQLLLSDTATLDGVLKFFWNFSGPYSPLTIIHTSNGVNGTFASYQGLAAGWTVVYTANDVILEELATPEPAMALPMLLALAVALKRRRQSVAG